MVSFNDLPLELVEQICQHLEKPAIQALRLTDRRCTVYTTKSFQRCFEKVSINCTLHGLKHLEFLASRAEFVDKVQRVQLHVDDQYATVVADGLALQNPDLYKSPEPWSPSGPNPYPKIYGWIRKSLLASLNTFPNLKQVLVGRRQNGFAKLADVISAIELVSGKPVPSDTSARAFDPSSGFVRPEIRTRGFETLYSIVPALTQPNIELAFDASPPDTRPRIITASTEENLQMFGVEQLDTSAILHQHLRQLRIYDKRPIQHDSKHVSTWLRGLLSVHAITHGVRSFELNGFEFKTGIIEYMGQVIRFGFRTIHLPQLSEITISNTKVLNNVLRFFRNHLPGLTKVTLVNNKSFLKEVWKPLLAILNTSKVLEYLHLDRLNFSMPESPPDRRIVATRVEWSGQDDIKTKLTALLASEQFKVLETPGRRSGEEWVWGSLDLLQKVRGDS